MHFAGVPALRCSYAPAQSESWVQELLICITRLQKSVVSWESFYRRPRQRVEFLAHAAALPIGLAAS